MTALMVGLPGSGKSTYLGALYYLLRKKGDPRLALAELPEERDYAQELEETWLRFRPFERSKLPAPRPLDLRLIGPEAGDFDFSIPDITGESYDELWEHGVWRDPVKELAVKARGILLFVHPGNLIAPELIDVSVEQADGNTTPTTWTPEGAPTQAVLCDVLESISVERNGQMPRLAVVVSAWDTIDDLGVGPDKWIELQTPLLWQWLTTRDEAFEFETFGVSAQGGDVRNEETRNELAKSPDPLSRLLNGRGVNDLIEPLLWVCGN
jgi:Double-GTPase 1